MTVNSWQNLVIGWIKINVDGSLPRCGLGAAIDGKAREPSSGWLFGFKIAIGITYIFQFKPKAVLEGLRLTWDKGFRQVKLESHNALLIKVLQTGLAAVSNVVEIQMINNMCSKDWKVKFKSICGTNSKVADHLAKTISDDIDHLVVLEDPSS
ncbi:hypothetical protein Goarm_006685 [Gossypium armourianum]|uniref:RNase H type-1 domain-containing protein n=1 Tax=Gossypium armourianum TaxID=34283 RepID=A0A7J9JIT1_9ROSI|nr:hypothetical protein [Gossypium armourianum]